MDKITPEELEQLTALEYQIRDLQAETQIKTGEKAALINRILKNHKLPPHAQLSHDGTIIIPAK